MRSVDFLSPIRRRSPLNKGLLRWWLAEPFRTGSPRLRDLTSKSSMTLTEALRLGPRGRPGGAGSSVFDGTNDRGTVSAIDLTGTSTLAVSFWMYAASFLSDDRFVIETSANYNSNTGAFVINPHSSTGSFFVGIKTSGGYNVSEFTKPSGAVWHHYVVNMNRAAGAQQVTHVYLDGVAQSLTNPFADTNTGNFGNFAWNFMSRNAASNFAAGRIDDVRIYNRVLPAWEVRALLAASRRGYPQELRWSRGAEFGGYVEPVAEETEVQTFSVGGSGPLGSEEIPNTVLASATSLTPPAGTKYATIQAVGANFNFFLSGDTPTTGTTGDGRKLYNYGMIELDSGFTSAKFIREGNTANSKLVVEYFSRKLEE